MLKENEPKMLLNTHTFQKFTHAQEHALKYDPEEHTEQMREGRQGSKKESTRNLSEREIGQEWK